MSGWPASFLSPELGDLADEARRLFQELAPAAGTTGDCVPPLDVLETDDALEVLIDLPGVSPDSVRVLFKGGVILAVGEKVCQTPVEAPSGYHLVERAAGRFARAVRLTGAFDASRARATLVNGELRISLPKIAERRGRPQPVRIETGTQTA